MLFGNLSNCLQRLARSGCAALAMQDGSSDRRYITSRVHRPQDLLFASNQKAMHYHHAHALLFIHVPSSIVDKGARRLSLRSKWRRNEL